MRVQGVIADPRWPYPARRTDTRCPLMARIPRSAPWATLTHILRQAAFTYEDATALPLPLHLAKLAEEYALWEPTSNDSEG